MNIILSSPKDKEYAMACLLWSSSTSLRVTNLRETSVLNSIMYNSPLYLIIPSHKKLIFQVSLKSCVSIPRLPFTIIPGNSFCQHI